VTVPYEGVVVVSIDTNWAVWPFHGDRMLHSDSTAHPACATVATAMKDTTTKPTITRLLIIYMSLQYSYVRFYILHIVLDTPRLRLLIK
jgi:hypothetical protein